MAQYESKHALMLNLKPKYSRIRYNNQTFVYQTTSFPDHTLNSLLSSWFCENQVSPDG